MQRSPGGLNFGNQETYVPPAPGDPFRVTWHRWLIHLGYLPFGEVWDCPSTPPDFSFNHIRYRTDDRPSGPASYGINYWHFFQPTSRSNIDAPSVVWHVADTQKSWVTDPSLNVWRIIHNYWLHGGMISEIHSGGSNVLFTDGHGEWMKRETLFPMKPDNEQYWDDAWPE